MQPHRGRTDEARRETARAADRKRLGKQNEVDVRRSQRLTSYHCLCSATAKLYQSFPRGISARSTTYALVSYNYTANNGRKSKGEESDTASVVIHTYRY